RSDQSRPSRTWQRPASNRLGALAPVSKEKPMPTFDTPEPIAVRVEAAAGSVRLTATDRDDTVVTVRAHDESRAADVRAADQTQVYYDNGKLSVSARRGFALFRGGAVDIDIALPSRSRVKASVASADVRAQGGLADCKIASASGDVDLD